MLKFKNIICRLTILCATLLYVQLPTTSAISCAGCVDLDELNFDKTVSRFPYALVKFDIAFPYGEKHEAFAEFSRVAHKVTDKLLVATVGIKDYGEMENKELGLRFDAHEKNFPGIVLFRGNTKKGFLKLPGHLDVTVNNLKKFVSDNTELYIGRDGCLKEFNDLVQNYANLDDDMQKLVLSRAEEMMEKLTSEEDKISANTYQLFMQKLNEKGYDFVEEETKRLLRLRAGKVNDAKKLEITRKLNVLEAFRVSKLTKTTKQEL